MSLVEKVKTWFGAEDAYEDGFDELFSINSKAEEANQEAGSLLNFETAASKKKTSKSDGSNPQLKVLERTSYSPTNEVVVLEPQSFDQAPEVIQYLRRGSSVVLNLCNLDTTQSQRLVDFVCGGIYAVEGSQKRVGEGVFLLVPSNVNINSVQADNKKLSTFWSTGASNDQSDGD